MNSCPDHPCRRASIHIFSLVLAVFMALAVPTFTQAAMTGENSDPPGTAENKSSVIIEPNASWNATIYRIAEGDCTIEWIAWNNEVGSVKYDSDCPGSLSSQMPLLAEIIETFLERNPGGGSLHTLFWGRLDPDYSPGLHELSFRLALAAYQSPGWDKKRGRARNGDVNGFVKELADRSMIYPELKELFVRFNKNVSVSCVEKVLIVAAIKLPFYDQLKKHGVKATDKLPFDCMTWFSITDMPTAR